MKDILLILTGGTIGSLADETGHNEARADQAVSLLEEGFRQSGSPFAGAAFTTQMPLNVLSENMTPARWATLAAALKAVDWAAWQGVIIAHGTDTLGFSANFLSLLLAGAPVPVCLVSSDYNLADSRANGPANFRAAVELISGGLAPGVYAPYQNADGKMYLHKGSRLHQSGDYTADFFSPGSLELNAPAAPGQSYALPAGSADWAAPAAAAGPALLPRLENMDKKVLRLQPYVGLDYANVNLDGVQAVVHGLYHSATACAQIAAPGQEYDSFSLLHLQARCSGAGIPLYLQPCNSEAYGYSSTGILLGAGAKALWGMIPEMAYVKTWLGVNLGFAGEELDEFLNRDICGEHFC